MLNMARVENAKHFFNQEKDSDVLLTMFGDYARAMGMASYEKDYKAYEEAEINYYAIRFIINDRLKEGK